MMTGLPVSVAYSGSAEFCELYAVGHFGNWYEVAGEREMRNLLREAREWGFNAYADWFDTLDCTDPFKGDPQYSLGNALWDRKKVHFATAQSLGLRTDLVITPNHVFRDQLRPENKVKPNPRIIGQLICPHAPGAWEMILQNYRNMLADLAAAGIRLTDLTAAPYDYGGCDCDQCRPWILTFARLTVEIHDIAREYHPGITLRFIGWWWTADEHRQFAEWMDAHAAERAVSLSLHIPYGKTTVADVSLPKGCERHAFVHIGYSDQASPRDVYGRTGPVIAAHRLEATVRDLRRRSVTGVVAYSEGICDDVNKVLLAALWSGTHASGEDILHAYARRYFGLDDAQARDWTDWVIPWGTPFDRNALQAREALAALTPSRTDWRWKQWQVKVDMFVAHQAIGTGADWTSERLARAEDFWASYEKLNREVYGLGPLRHILGPTYIGLPWYKSWVERQRKQATRPSLVPAVEAVGADDSSSTIHRSLGLLAGMERSYWIHASLAPKPQRGYWGIQLPASLPPSEEQVRKAGDLLVNHYGANRLYLVYHKEINLREAADVFSWWKQHCPAGIELVPMLVMRTYDRSKNEIFTAEELRSLCDIFKRKMGCRNMAVFDVHPDRDQGPGLSVLAEAFPERLIRVGLQPGEKLNLPFTAAVEDTWSAFCHGKTNTDWQDKGFGAETLRQWINERNRTSFPVAYDLIVVAWDYGPATRGEYPGYDDANRNMPLPADRNSLAVRAILETSASKNLAGFSSDLTILQANSRTDTHDGQPSSFYEVLKEGKVYDGYYAGPLEEVAAIYRGLRDDRPPQPAASQTSR